jgi:hypothetical protein
MAKEVTPQLGLLSYSCPHCGALSHQTWFQVFARSFTGGNKPNPSRVGNAVTGGTTINRAITSSNLSGSTSHVQSQMSNLFFAQCYSCKSYSIWVADGLIYPAQKVVVQPHDDMPDDVKADFLEAASIVELSPRGAAALLRLAIQKLMVDLGEKGDNINVDIASLVKKGLETEIQQALDVVRVIGNSAVHPGSLDLKDDKGIATALLHLVNLVVDRRIAAQNRIKEMFDNLPAGALGQIERRDGIKLSVVEEDPPKT